MVELQRSGLSFLVNYSWSRSLDTGTGNNHGSGIDEYQNAFSPAANYGLSDFNATNTVSGQITWELPFGSGRQFALHGIADEIVGGWRASGVFQWHSGLPYTPVIQGSVADGVDPGLTPSFSAGSTLYPEIVGNPTVSNPTISHWFNTAAFANPAGGTFGNTGRNTLIGPGFTDVDFSIGKEFSLHVREGMKLEIRADAFNVFNHPNFANPDADVGLLSNGQLADSAGGTISHTENYTGQRIVQLGLHFRF